MGKMQQYALGACLFTFLFVVVGGALHLNTGGAFLAALSGTPLMIHIFSRWLENQTARMARDHLCAGKRAEAKRGRICSGARPTTQSWRCRRSRIRRFARTRSWRAQQSMK